MIPAVGQPVHVIGQKFYDYEKDGNFDSYDFTMEGWNVSLYWLNSTAVPGKWNITNMYGNYNISNIDPYFNYTVREEVQSGWTPTTPSSYTVYFVTCGDEGNLEYFTTQSNMEAFMPTVNDGTSKVQFGYNARIGNSVQSSASDEEGKIFYPQGQWNPGQQSVSLSPEINYTWTNNTYAAFNASYRPGQNATWTINGVTVTQDTPFPTRPNAVPIRDMVIRLHSERSDWNVTINNVILKQGPYTYNLVNSPLSMTEDGGQDKWLVLRASDILIAAGGMDLASGGFDLTGDIKLIWQEDSSPSPSGNKIKMDVYIGRYDCYPVYGVLRNFGNYRGGNISGYKLDMSGTGLSGWNITLANETLGISRYAVTDGTGYYEIQDVPVGIYWLNETLADWPDWIPVNGNRTVEINLTTWDLFNQNFTNREKGGNVSGYKLNETGYGLAGWNITISNETAGFFGSNITNVTGYYIIQSVPQNTYWLNETLESGWVQITPNRTIELNETFPSLSDQNFTNQWEDGIIEGYKLNETGYGLSGWTIELYNGTQFIASTSTDGTGYYNFTGLAADTYNVSEILQTGWTALGPLYYDNQVLNDQTSPITGLNFTNQWEDGIIEGYKLNETGYGLSGWTIELYNGTQFIASTGTDGTGYYNFTGLPADTYNVSEILQTGWVALSPEYYDGLALNEFTSPLLVDDFVNQWMNGTIEGYKLNEVEQGLAGWTIELYNGTQLIASTSTDGTGHYSFSGLSADTYNVSEVLKNGWMALGPLYIDGLGLDEGNPVISGQNFTNQWENGIIEGYKLNETGYGLSGWTIELYNGTQFIDSTNTDGTGYYNFTGLPADTYNVSEILETGWTALGPLYYNNQVLNDQTSPITGRNFTNQQLFGYISGYKIQNETGLGVPGWTIEAYNQSDDSFAGSDITDGTGFYNITGLPYGVTYNVSEVIEPGWTPVSPTFVNDLTIDDQTPYHVNVNFTNDPPVGTGTITGTKFCQDCTEPGCGIPGWTITLSYTNGTVYETVITGFGGFYEFNDVPYGIYWLNETVQEGWTQVTPNIMVTLDEANQSFSYDFINTETSYCCGCKPTASFTYTKDGPTVTFTDTSTGPIAQRWIWFFGDGTLSTAQNPVKSYKKPGTYTVTLHVNWAYCSDSPPVWKSYSQRITVP